jgi:RNA polymerase sigma-70 factor, ECF subfamily
MTSDPGARSDAALVAAVAGGDMGALALLYDRHADAIYRASFRRLGDPHLAEEVLQDTFLALWNRAELFDPAHGSLPAWLGTIARNRAIDRMRARGRRPTPVSIGSLAGDDGDDDALDAVLTRADRVGSGPTPLGPPEHADAMALREDLRAALARLPAPERQVLELAYAGGLTQTEISARLGWPLGTVKTRTRRGLLRMRAALTRGLELPISVAATPAVPSGRAIGDSDERR